MLRACWVFPCFALWKLVLACAFVLPMPANDAFFFDGAVIHFLNGEGYFNPSLAQMFSVNGTELFSAYPPFYQAVLLPWMSLFGTSARSSVVLHAVLLCLFAFLSLRLLWRAGVAPRTANLAGLLLFGLTFHDRPDSVAQVLGICALLAMLRASRDPARQSAWQCAAAAAVVLACATSLHIGAMYGAMFWLYSLLAGPRRGGARLPLLLVTALIPPASLLGVACLWPTAWTGFSENLLATPSFTGLRLPALDELLKVLRNSPALFLGAAALLHPRIRSSVYRILSDGGVSACLLFSIFLPALFAAASALFLVSPNYVYAASYPQVVASALFLGALVDEVRGGFERYGRLLLAGCACLISLRAMALSSWGVLSAVDLGYQDASERVRREGEKLAPGSTAVVSSAYLYALQGKTGAGESRFLHADWCGKLGSGVGELRPDCLLLSAYDYHRRYERVIEELRLSGQLEARQVEMPGRIPVPDASPLLRRVVQHLSWAPVIIHLRWAHPKGKGA